MLRAIAAQSAMKHVMLSAILVAASVLSGCVLTNPTDPYGSPGPEIRHHPVRPVPPPGAASIESPLTLPRAIETALANNPDVGAAVFDIEAARARRRVASSQLLPRVGAESGYDHHLDGQRLIPKRDLEDVGVFTKNIVSGDLVVVMPIFTGGRIISEIRAAELLQRSAEHLLARTREELVFNVSSAFLSILGQRRVIESLRFSRTAMEGQYRRVKDLLAADKAARVDLLRIEVRLAELDQETVREENTTDILQRTLVNLMGLRDVEEEIDLRGELSLAEAHPALRESIERAYRDRPDYLAARSDLEAQASKVDVARAELWPTVSLTGSYGGRWAPDTLERPPGERTLDDVGQLGGVVDVPLFEGGRIMARIREERAKLAASRERLRRLELSIALEVETAILDISSSRRRVTAVEKAVEQSEESLRIEQLKYELGKGSITDVLDAQAEMLKAQVNHCRALVEYNTAVARLGLVTGSAL